MEQQVVVICSVCREPIEAGERSVECDEVGCAASRMHVACRPRCLYCGHEGCPSCMVESVEWSGWFCDTRTPEQLSGGAGRLESSECYGFYVQAHGQGAQDGGG